MKFLHHFEIFNTAISKVKVPKLKRYVIFDHKITIFNTLLNVILKHYYIKVFKFKNIGTLVLNLGVNSYRQCSCGTETLTGWIEYL